MLLHVLPLLLLLLSPLRAQQHEDERDPWVGVLSRELLGMRECLPSPYRALMDDWFAQLNDTAQQEQLCARALDGLQRALEARKPFCRALTQALHRTLQRMQYQMAQQQHKNVQRGWPETHKRLRQLRHTQPAACDETLYQERGAEMRRCMSDVRARAMQRLSVYHIGQ